MAGAALAARSVRRVEVYGDSMRPALEPGDRVLAIRLGPLGAVRPGQLVVVRDPRLPSRLLVKRVGSNGAAGVVVLGDNAGASTDSRQFGPVAAVWGRAVYRYSPANRAGWLGKSVPQGGR